MTCIYCSKQEVRDAAARLKAAEALNTDLVRIVGQLVDKHIHFDLHVETQGTALEAETQKREMTVSVASAAKSEIERMLSNRYELHRRIAELTMERDRSVFTIPKDTPGGTA